MSIVIVRSVASQLEVCVFDFLSLISLCLQSFHLLPTVQRHAMLCLAAMTILKRVHFQSCILTSSSNLSLMTMYERENNFFLIPRDLLGKQTSGRFTSLTCGRVPTTQTAFQLSKACSTTEGLQYVPSGNWTLQMHGSAVKKSLFSLPGVKTGGGGGKEERGSLSRTPCQEGRTRAEQHHSRRKKTSVFQGGQLWSWEVGVRLRET